MIDFLARFDPLSAVIGATLTIIVGGAYAWWHIRSMAETVDDTDEAGA